MYHYYHKEGYTSYWKDFEGRYYKVDDNDIYVLEDASYVPLTNPQNFLMQCENFLLFIQGRVKNESEEEIEAVYQED